MHKVIAILIVLSLSSCGEDLKNIPALSGENQAAVSEILDPEVIYTDQAVLRIKIVGPRMLVYEGTRPKVEFPDGVRIYFYDTEGRMSSKIRADYAVRQEVEQKTILKKDVWFISAKGEKMNTEELVWDEERENLFSNLEVTMANDVEVVTGQGFEAKQDFSNYRVKKITGYLDVADYQGAKDF